MIKFIHFLKKIYFPLLFIILVMSAIHFYAGSSAYTKVRITGFSNKAAGGVYSQLSAVNSYFHLRHENAVLNEEIARLHNTLDSLADVRHPGLTAADSAIISSNTDRTYEYFAAKVVNNTLTRQENYITLNMGSGQGMEPNMAVISNGGIAGYIEACSEKFSICRSALNVNFRTSGKLKGSDYTGSILWDGVSWEFVTLTEVPKYAEPAIGDTVITTDFSDIFPPDIMIGTVAGYELVNNIYYEIKVRLQANMATLSNVMVVRYPDGKERVRLESLVNGNN